MIDGSEDLIQDELTFECDKYVYVPFQNVDDEGNLIYYSDGDFTGIVGSIVNLFESNISRNFVSRGYAKITKDDETTIIYSNTVSTRSAKYIANEICAVDGWENNYSLEQVELIDKWSKSN